MSLSDWLRKRWYVLLICVALACGLMSVLGHLYFYPLARYSSLVGGLLGFGVTYLIYGLERPEE